MPTPGLLSAGMSEVLEMLLEVVFNIAIFVLEIAGDSWLGDLTWPDTTAGRIVLFIIIIVLGGVIYWELR